MMTDDELIADFEKRFDSADMARVDDEINFARLIALARVGAAVQPRPISEAPRKGGQQFYTVFPDSLYSITWFEGAKKWKTHVFSKQEVTHFYDLKFLTQLSILCEANNPQVKP